MASQFNADSTFTRNKKFNPDGSGRFQQRAIEQGKATRGQSFLEYLLFGVFSLMILVAGVAMVSINSPEHKRVPNTVQLGLQDGRVNILLIGARVDKDAPPSDRLIAQSLTVLSIEPRARQAALITVPRDMWVKVGRYGRHRIASALNIGASSGYPGEGPGLMSDTVQDVIGQPVHGFVRIETADLIGAINRLGGVDIDVRASFVDAGQKIRFNPGLQHFDGLTAYRYAFAGVRGPQGTREAREARQAQVLNAAMEKIRKGGDAALAAVLQGVTDRGNDGSATNLTIDQARQLVATMREANAVHTVSLAPLLRSFEVRSFGDGAGEALRPNGDDFAPVQQLARDVFGPRQELPPAQAAMVR